MENLVILGWQARVLGGADPQRYYDRDPWRGTYSHDGGALTNQGVHYIDILRHLGEK